MYTLWFSKKDGLWQVKNEDAVAYTVVGSTLHNSISRRPIATLVRVDSETGEVSIHLFSEGELPRDYTIKQADERRIEFNDCNYNKVATLDVSISGKRKDLVAKLYINENSRDTTEILIALLLAVLGPDGKIRGLGTLPSIPISLYQYPSDHSDLFSARSAVRIIMRRPIVGEQQDVAKAESAS